MKKSREELVKLILIKSKSKETIGILAFSTDAMVEEIYNQLYNIK